MSTFSLVPLTSFKEYNVYSLDEVLVLFHLKDMSLHVLDELSSWLILSLDAGLSHAELKQELIENNIDTKELDTAFSKIDNLLKPNLASPSYRQEYDEIITSSTSCPSTLPCLISITLLGKSFEVRSPCLDLQQYFQSISFDSRFKPEALSKSPDYQIVIEQTRNSYTLICNGVQVTKTERYEHIMPILMDHMQILAYQSVDYLLAVHSAMLTYKGRGLMLPGSSGSGKSTLAISLLAKGFECLSDEVSLISARDNKLMPLPLPVAIKSGSWNVIRDDFPNIDELPIWERKDGRRSKYIHLPHSEEGHSDSIVKCIIFPHYQADQYEAELLSIDSISALKYLTDAGYQIRDGLTTEKVEQILLWISGIPVYELSYNSLDQAHRIIDQLMK